MRTSGFETIGRQCTLKEPTDVSDQLFAAAERLLGRLDHPGPFRLVGMAVFDLQEAREPAQMPLLVDARERALEVVLDKVEEKYGTGSLRRARDLDGSTVIRTSPNLDSIDNAPEADG